MIRLITATLLLLTLFMAGASAVDSGAPAAMACAEAFGEQQAMLDAAGQATEGDQDPSLGTEHTDWPTEWPAWAAWAAQVAPTPARLPQAWPSVPTFALRSAHTGPTPPPPRARA